MNPVETVLLAIANRECDRLARKVIRHLQGMKDCLQSGYDSPLENAWDELCCQVQGQESPMWELYIDLVETIVLGVVEKLNTETKQAIWLQTDEAIRWAPEEDDADIPWSNEEISQYILNDYVMKSAADWTNARIEKFKEREFD
jgi:hypothetical protein